MQPALRTERLDLVPLKRGHLESFHRIWGDPEVIWWGHTEDLVATEEFIDRILARTADQPVGTGWWILEQRETGVVVGDAVLQPVPREPVEMEVGWHLARQHWGCGYATEAARCLVDHALGTLDLGVVVADIALQNGRSMAVATRLGMVRRPDLVERAGMPHSVWEIRSQG